LENDALKLSDVAFWYMSHLFRFALLPTSSRPETAYQLVDSPRLGEILLEARNAYDYVVIDAPPSVPVADCRALARWVDGFLLVVAANRTSRRMVSEALSLMEPHQLLGLVFNDDEEPVWSGTDRYYFRYGPPP